MYLAQTKLEIDSNRLMNHKNGHKVVMVEKTKTQPKLDWFVFKSDYDKFGRNCEVYLARIKNNTVSNFYK